MTLAYLWKHKLNDMATVFAKTIGSILKVGGSILSLIPAVGPLVGPSIMAAGTAIYTKQTGTTDTVTLAANKLLESQTTAANMLQAGTASQTFSGIGTWIKNNLVIVALAFGGLIFFMTRKKHRR